MENITEKIEKLLTYSQKYKNFISRAPMIKGYSDRDLPEEIKQKVHKIDYWANHECSNCFIEGETNLIVITLN